jgi:hypothetical protein
VKHRTFQKPLITKRDNAITAFAKIATSPLRTLTPEMVDSIARSHGVAAELLVARLAERQERESQSHG